MKYDYSEQDSLFQLYNSSKNGYAAENFIEKKVDSDSELLDFSRNKNKLEDTADSKLTPGSINLNTAGISELTKLPGIGIKTAERILDYRTKHNGFGDVNEILEVKGIGEAKFQKIKQYVFID